MARITSAARARAYADAEYPTATAFMPQRFSVGALREASASCRGCPLYKNATQTVFGEGPAGASVMFVGETPGDQEDRAGKPFVGPAGALLDKGLEEAGIDRADVYVTNVVKHFKFEPRGKRRIHSKPSAREIDACFPWLESEIATVKPKLLVCLGATAAQALIGKAFRVTKSRGQVLHDTRWAPAVVATVHPSSILRAPDDESRRRAYGAFLSDLSVVERELRRMNRRQVRSDSAQNARRRASMQWNQRGQERVARDVEPFGVTTAGSRSSGRGRPNSARNAAASDARSVR
jgi:DNA polymerase